MSRDLKRSIMINVSVDQENIRMLNMYVPNMRASEYMKQNWKTYNDNNDNKHNISAFIRWI